MVSLTTFYTIDHKLHAKILQSINPALFQQLENSFAQNGSEDQDRATGQNPMDTEEEDAESDQVSIFLDAAEFSRTETSSCEPVWNFADIEQQTESWYIVEFSITIKTLD